MKIEVWSDLVCPFCYIGKTQLEQAIEKFEYKDQIEVALKSYELDPYSKSDQNVSMYEGLAKKYNIPIEMAKAKLVQVAKSAADVGLTYNFDHVKKTNTLDAHRLIKFAQSKGKASEITERLYSAHFTESLFIGSHETLVKIAEEVGLDKDDVESVLKGNDYLEAVRADESEAKQIGIQGVPFFIINGKYSISGAQPIEAILESLQRAWQEEVKTHSVKQDQPFTGGVCSVEGC